MAAQSPTRNPRNQLVAGAFLGLWSVAGWWSALGTAALWTDDYGADPGPGLLPVLALSLLSAGALGLVLNGLRGMLSAPAAPGYWSGLRRHTLMPAVFVASLLVYVPAIELAGFIPASGAFALLWMAALGLKRPGGARPGALAAAGAGTLIGVGLIYFVFVVLIGVPVG